MLQSLRVAYRGHTIVAAVLRGKPAAQVYVGTTRVTPERFEGATVEDAIDRARVWIDTQRSAIILARRAPCIGTTDEYTSYFAASPPEGGRRAMLVAHAAASNLTLSAGQLAEAAGWPDFGSANLHYGLLGKEVAQALELKLPHHADGTIIATAALAGSAGPDWKQINGIFYWRMYEEVAEALSRLNIRQRVVSQSQGRVR